MSSSLFGQIAQVVNWPAEMLDRNGAKSWAVLTTAVLSSGTSIEAILSQPRRDQTGSSLFMIICHDATTSWAVSVSPF